MMVEMCNCNFVAPAYPDKKVNGQSFDMMVIAQARNVYDRLCEVVNEPVFAVGRSLGVGIALHACVSKAPAGIVLISGFTSVRDLAPGSLSCLMSDRYNNRLQIDAAVFTGVDKLIIHGSDDTLIPTQHALALRDSTCRTTLEVICAMEHCPDHENWHTICTKLAEFFKGHDTTATRLVANFPVWKS